MDPVLILMRLIHVVLGVFWGGVVLFNVLYLVPAFRDAGPGGAAVSAGLMRRQLFNALAIAAALTLLSGVWLLWRVSGGFRPEYFASKAGLTYALGGAAAIVGYALGFAVIRPAMTKSAALMQQIGPMPPGPERDARAAEAAQLQARGAKTGQGVAALIFLAIVAMSVARYLG